MTITFPTPTVQRPNLKRYAMAGVAALAIAASAVGVAAIVNNDSATSPMSAAVGATAIDTAIDSVQSTVEFDPGRNAVSALTGLVPAEPAVSAQLEQFAAANGLSGLSPASLGPVTSAATGTAAIPDTGRVPATPVEADAAQSFFLTINDVQAAPEPPSVEADAAQSFFLGINDVEVAAGQASALLDPAAFESAIAEAVRAVAPATDTVRDTEAGTAAEVGSVAWLQANGWLPETGTGHDGDTPEVLPRTDFASDHDWLVANGFIDGGPR